MSAGTWNSFQSLFGNFFVYHRTFHYATQRLVKQDRDVKGSRTYDDPGKYEDDADTTEERRLSCQLYMKWVRDKAKTDKLDTHSQTDTLAKG